MPSQLHPRSRATSTLFASTLAVCFLVVGLPHALPCPAPRLALADVERGEDGRVRRKGTPGPPSAGDQGLKESMVGLDLDSEQRRARECPVPKPGGRVGQMLGFEKAGRNGSNGET